LSFEFDRVSFVRAFQALDQAPRHAGDLRALIDQIRGLANARLRRMNPLAQFQACDDLLQRSVRVSQKPRELRFGLTA